MPARRLRIVVALAAIVVATLVALALADEPSDKPTPGALDAPAEAAAASSPRLRTFAEDLKAARAA